MKSIKDWILLLALCIILMLTAFYQKPITQFIIDKTVFKEGVVIDKPNNYALSYAFQYIHTTDDFNANSYQELLNIVYTGLNYGNSSFYFYCEYDTCEQDVGSLIDNHNLVNINNFVHPYNNYRKINISVNSLHKVTFFIGKSYSDIYIQQINNKMKEIETEIITPDMTDRDKIKAFHDYIINHTKYDSAYIAANVTDIDSPSHKALGPLFYGKALCGGYTDVMAIFLDDLGIPNYRISSEYHVWNLVKLDNIWYHLDLTWDDPVTSDGSDLLLDSFFLITTDELNKLNTGYHDFDNTIFLETQN